MKNTHEFDNTLCGVLPAQEIIKLISADRIYSHLNKALDKNVQPASLDLTLGTKAYRLQASFLPQGKQVREKMNDLVMYEVNIENGAVLEREAVYLIPLQEQLHLPFCICGKTNPKSSIGRLDVFTRVIADLSGRFENIENGYKGELFLEVVPRSFAIKVKTGQKLNQLRLFHVAHENLQISDFPYPDNTSSSKIELNSLELNEINSSKKGLLFDSRGYPIDISFRHLASDGLLMSVDLSPNISNGSNSGVVGFKAKKNSHVIDLEKISHYDADDFWETIHPPKNGRLILEPEEFYIFASKERIRIPLDCAAEMVEFDAGSGELRTHYAGFFDPGFGYGGKGEVTGTKAVLEVRPHDVPFIIEDGQILFKMKYERMSSPSAIWYGTELGSNYYDQTLRLAKQFRK